MIGPSNSWCGGCPGIPPFFPFNSTSPVSFLLLLADISGSRGLGLTFNDSMGNFGARIDVFFSQIYIPGSRCCHIPSGFLDANPCLAIMPAGSSHSSNTHTIRGVSTMACDGVPRQVSADFEKPSCHPTVDGPKPAPPKKPWNGYSFVNTNKQWFPMVLTWCRILSIHSMSKPGIWAFECLNLGLAQKGSCPYS